MTNRINTLVRDSVIALLLVAGVTLLSWQALLLEWRYNAGSESDIQARGPFIAAMLLPYIITVAGVLVAIFLVAVARSRRPARHLLIAVGLAVGGLLADLFICGGTLLLAPALLLAPVFGNAALGLVASIEIVVGLLLLWPVPRSARRGPAPELP